MVEQCIADYCTASDQLLCNVYRSANRPLLRLPNRSHASLPSGTVPIVANGKTYEAVFGASIGEVRRPGDDLNILPQLLRTWFGHDAGHSGTRHQVELVLVNSAWTLQPFGVDPPAGAVVGKLYAREQIPALRASVQHRGWNKGFVRSGKHIFLLVTLNKKGLAYRHPRAAPELRGRLLLRGTRAARGGWPGPWAACRPCSSRKNVIAGGIKLEFGETLTSGDKTRC